MQQGQDPATAAEQLRREPGVELVEPNFLNTHAQVVPNDARFGEQWAHRNTGQAGGVPGSDIGVANAWGTATGSPSAVVAVIDSGIDFTHPDLRGNQWANAREQVVEGRVQRRRQAENFNAEPLPVVDRVGGRIALRSGAPPVNVYRLIDEDGDVRHCVQAADEVSAGEQRSP